MMKKMIVVNLVICLCISTVLCQGITTCDVKAATKEEVMEDYKEFLMDQLNKSSGDDNYKDSFAIYDINHDGTKELIFMRGLEYDESLYTYYNGKIKEIETILRAHTDLKF